MPPRYDFERVYFHWFRVAPPLLYNVLRREDIPEHVRDLVLRRSPHDDTMWRVDEVFSNAMVYVLNS